MNVQRAALYSEVYVYTDTSGGSWAIKFFGVLKVVTYKSISIRGKN